MKNKLFIRIIPGLLVLLLFLAVYSYVYDAKLDLNGDNAAYFMLGKALAGGHGYVNLNSIEQTENNHFPPGYPAILSVLIKIFGESYNVPKLFNGLCFMGVLILLFYSGRELTASLPVVMITIFSLLLNSHLLRYSTIIMSELPFLLLSLLAIFFFSTSRKDSEFLKDSKFYLTILFIVGSFYVRSTGIALLLSIILYLLHKRHWQQALAYCGAFILLVAPWLIRGQILGGNSYLHQLIMVNPYRPGMGELGIVDLINRLFDNLSRYISTEIPSAVFSFIRVDYQSMVTPWLWFTGLTFIIVAGYGLWHLQKFRWLIVYYVLSTFGILILWPEVWVGVRFLLPILPFLVLGFFIGLETLIIKLGATKTWYFWLPGILLFAYITPLRNLHYQAIKPYDNSWVNYFEMAQYLQENEHDKVVVACRKPVIFYLHANTFTTNYKYTTDQTLLIQDLRDKKVTYVVLEQLGYSSTLRYLFPVFRDQPDLFEIIKQNDKPNTYLVQLLEEK